MLDVDHISKVRLARFRDGKGIREIARDLGLSRNTVRSIIRSGITDQKYERTEQPRPKLGSFLKLLAKWLKEDSEKPVRHRRRAQILFEQLQREGYDGGYDAVRRYVGIWQREIGTALVNAFIPLEFDPGDAFQFDWSYEDVELGGVPVKVKVAQFRLCHSRKPFCVAYTRESLEMVLDAHIRAFEFYGGLCRRGIYDNLKAVVIKVLMGKDRVFNRRFQSLASHYLFDLVACTPAAGWEKGQVENQVGLVRYRFFATRRRFASLEEVSTKEQNIDSQLDQLAKAGCIKVITDTISGTTKDRPGWSELMECLRTGDTVVVTELSRMSRSLLHFLITLQDLEKMGVHVESLRENIDPSTATGRAFMGFMGVIHQLELDLKAERAAAGRASAKARGKTGGRPRTDQNKLEQARILYENSDKTSNDVCKLAGVGRRTFFAYLAGIKST